VDVRLLAAPEVATGSAPAVPAGGGKPVAAADRSGPSGRPVHVVIRRRRVLSVVLSAAALFTLVGAVPGMRALWWAAAALGLLAVGYLALVARISHLQERREMARAFGQVDVAGEFDWQELGWELELATRADDADGVVVPVELGNRELGHFLLAYALGWMLTPVVTMIRLFRHDLGRVKRHGLAGRIVALQQYGRSRSLRLLTVGAAATVGITGVSGMAGNAFASPGIVASAGPARAPGVLAAPESAATYTVQPGDTLYRIAARYHTTAAALAATNHVANPNLILVGQVLAVPGGTAGAGAAGGAHTVGAGVAVYSVRSGDTLGAIAARYKTTVAALVAANHLANPNLIRVGQSLSIPGGTAVPAAPGAAAPRAATAPAAAAKPATSPAPSASPAPPPVTLTAAVSGAGLPLPLQYLRGGTVDQGVDYAAPGGTPLYAMGPGIIIREGMSGFGPGTPVLQITSGPLAGKTVYYGHAGPDLVPVGAHVVQGQQISSVGYGIVGFSTGPHLEVGFYPPGGNGSGQAMLNYIDGLVGHSTHR
jgi:LysM repeat protein